MKAFRLFLRKCRVLLHLAVLLARLSPCALNRPKTSPRPAAHPEPLPHSCKAHPEVHGVPRDHCFAERLAANICHVVLTLDSAHPQSLGPDLVLNTLICQIYVFQTTNSLSVETVFNGLGICGQQLFHIVS